MVLNTIPSANSSANEDLIFVAYDATKATDPVTYPDYNYVLDIWIGSDMYRQKSSPDPSYKRGLFNISEVVRSYLNYSFNPATGIRCQEFGSGEFWVDVICKFGEEYNFTTYTNILTDSTRKYFNHYNGRLIGSTTNLVSNTVLSNRPLITDVHRSTENLFIPYFPSTTSAFTVEIKTYNASGIQTTVSSNITPTAAYNLQQLNISPACINVVHSNIITDAITYYTVNIAGTVYRFNLICEPKYEVHTIHFLNKYAGFETFEFSKVSKKTIDIEKKTFSKKAYDLKSDGTIAYYNSGKVYNEINSTYATSFEEKLKINSDLLTDAEYQWLAELVLSPTIYIEKKNSLGNIYLIPVSINQSNYEFKEVINDKLTNLTLDLEFGDTFNTQFK